MSFWDASQACSLLFQLHWRFQERKQYWEGGFGASFQATVASTLSIGPWLYITAKPILIWGTFV